MRSTPEAGLAVCVFMVTMRRASSGVSVFQVTGLPTRVWPPPLSFGSESDGSFFLIWRSIFVQSNAQPAGNRKRSPDTPIDPQKLHEAADRGLNEYINLTARINATA
ncbi:hypothetical protein [Pseudomonas sp. BS3782 TE3695]|uniref:hypothetical protein n=1 Tax=Pseudomonas sp. BS3782 TE3695 TaxID=3349323 RepID=UPI003D25B58B